jgi:hypothetical protein
MRWDRVGEGEQSGSGVEVGVIGHTLYGGQCGAERGVTAWATGILQCEGAYPVTAVSGDLSLQPIHGGM